MTTLRIIEFETGQFAIQVREGWRRWGYCALKEYYIWYVESGIRTYCIADSLEEVEKALEVVIADIRNKAGIPPYIKLPRIKRVVMKVRV